MILSCNSTKPSICGVALSWKYKPQGLGVSQLLYIILFIKKSILYIEIYSNLIIVILIIKKKHNALKKNMNYN